MIDLNNFEPKLITKEDILSHFNEVDIFNYYLDNEIVQLKHNIKSPLGKDSVPSFGFFIGEGNEICFKDFRLGAGDFVKFVMMKFNINYYEALSKIVIDLGIEGNFVLKKTTLTIKHPIKYDKENILKSYEKNKLRKKRREWNLYDKAYWKSYGISSKTLEKYNVEPISHIFLGDKIIQADRHAYCYIEHKDGIETYKIYQPFNKEYKWLNNHNYSVIQGWSQLPDKGEDLIITKSLKDVMSIVENTGIPSIALQNENLLPKNQIVEQLKNRFNNIYLLYDNDFDKEINYGQKYVEKLLQEFGGAFNIVVPDKYQCKDFTDLYKTFGKDVAVKFIKDNLMPF